MVQLQVLTSSAVLQNVTQDCYFLLHRTVTSSKGKNLQPARMLRRKVPKFTCFFSDLWTVQRASVCTLHRISFKCYESCTGPSWSWLAALARLSWECFRKQCVHFVWKVFQYTMQSLLYKLLRNFVPVFRRETMFCVPEE